TPFTQVVSSVVAPATPLPAQVALAPLVGPSVAEEGLAAWVGIETKKRPNSNKTGITPLRTGGRCMGTSGLSEAAQFWDGRSLPRVAENEHHATDLLPNRSN